MKIEQTSVNIN